MVRGEVRRLRDRRRSEQRGARFAVIVQADELLALSTVLGAPTSRSAPARSFRPLVALGGKATRVLVEQLTAVSTERLGESAGRLNAQELRAVDEALAMSAGHNRRALGDCTRDPPSTAGGGGVSCRRA